MKLQVLFGILVVCRLEEGNFIIYRCSTRCAIGRPSRDKDLVIQCFLLIPRFLSLSLSIYFNERMAEKSHGRINNTLSISFVDTGKKIHLL